MAPLSKALALVAMLAGSSMAWNIEYPACDASFQPFVSLGCYDNKVGNNLIFRSIVDSDDMTVEKCQAICKGNNFRYAGLQYYGNCYCGNIIQGAAVDKAECDLPCGGNETQTCGGRDSLSVYADPTFPETLPKTSDYTAIGCWTDSSKGRTLGWQEGLDFDTMTPDKCIAACAADGLPYAGLEFGGECWCGTTLRADTSIVPFGECNQPCAGDPSLTCGAGNRLQLYQATSYKSSEVCGQAPDKGTTTTIVATTTKTTQAADTTKVDTTKTDTTVITKTVDTTKTETSKPTDTTKVDTTKTDKIGTTKAVDTTKTGTSKPTDTTKPEKTDITKTDKTATTKPADTTKPDISKPTDTKTDNTATTKPAGTTKPDTSRPTDTKTTLQTTTVATPSGTKIPSTTGNPQTTKTTGAPVCTTVIPDDKYCAGQWCSFPLPPWDDSVGCQTAAAQCFIENAMCFKKAGLTGVSGVTQCLQHKDFCVRIQRHCTNDCKPTKGSCSSNDHLVKNPPRGGKGPVTSTVPCGQTATATTSPSKPVPEPSNICVQPTDDYGYSPGNPVGGIEMPIVTCNNDEEDHRRGNHFKCYSERKWDDAPSFERKELHRACATACVEQYDRCLEMFVEGDQDDGKDGKVKDGKDGKDDKKDKDRKDKDRKDKDEDKEKKERRNKCKHHYADCLGENRNTDAGNKCLTWGKSLTGSLRKRAMR